jgi:hypothetical protein
MSCCGFKAHRIPRFGAQFRLRLVRRRDPVGPVATVFPEFIAREKPGQRGTGRQGRSAGLVRPAAQRGLGPARLDGQAPRATVAGKSDELGERRTAANGPGGALKPTPRGERPCASGTPSWMAVGRSGATCSVHARGAKQGAAGMGCPADPLEGKRRAQARSEETAGGIRDQSRMAATRHEARGNAREPDGGTPGCSTVHNKM